MKDSVGSTESESWSSFTFIDILSHCGRSAGKIMKASWEPAVQQIWGIMQGFCISWVLEIQQEYGREWAALYFLFLCSLLYLRFTGVDPKEKTHIHALLWAETVIGLRGFRQQLLIEGLQEHQCIAMMSQVWKRAGVKFLE